MSPLLEWFIKVGATFVGAYLAYAAVEWGKPDPTAKWIPWMRDQECINRLMRRRIEQLEEQVSSLENPGDFQ
jgi:hypothetical protein